MRKLGKHLGVLILRGGLLVTTIVFTSCQQEQFPRITQVIPDGIIRGTSQKIIIKGENFQPNATIQTSSKGIETSYSVVDSNTIDMTLSVSEVTEVKLAIVICNPNGRTSNEWIIFVHEGKPEPVPKDRLGAEAGRKLREEERRDNPRLTISRNKISLEELQTKIVASLEAAGFKIRMPQFDAENRLETHIAEFRGRIVPDLGHYESAIVHLRISDRNNEAWRLYLVTEGAHRRRKTDVDKEEFIQQHYLDMYSDSLVLDIKRQLYESSYKVSLSWSNGTDLDLRMFGNDGTVCSYISPKTSFGFLDKDLQNGGTETITLIVEHDSFTLEVEYYSGEDATDFELKLTDDYGSQQLSGSLARRGDRFAKMISLGEGHLRMER